MKIISHRGNLNGPSKELENNVSQIEQCLQMGYDVEIDFQVKFAVARQNPRENREKQNFQSNFLVEKLFPASKNEISGIV